MCFKENNMAMEIDFNDELKILLRKCITKIDLRWNLKSEHTTNQVRL